MTEREQTTLVRQQHDYGCGIASLAMVHGCTYEHVREWLIANWPGSSREPKQWLEVSGIHSGIAKYFLFCHGYVWRTNYAGWYEKTEGKLAGEGWLPEPFAPIHLVNVEQPSRNSHYVVMCADGTVLDPLSDEPKRLTDWPRVYNVQGIWPAPERSRD